MLDLACSAVLVAVVLAAAAAYGVRVQLRGRATSARVEREGESRLLSKGAMETFHWAIEPAGRLCERLGVTADGVSYAALGLALAAGVALGLGHMGVGAALAALAAAGDGLDGVVARRTGTVSEAGALLDAVVDRYGEFAFLAGLAFAFRESGPLLLLALFALLACFMVSYSSARAAALQLPAPRGSMRRTERAVYLTLGAGLSPLAAWANPAWARAPVIGTLALVAVVGNVSAVVRLRAIARGARERERGGARAPLSDSGWKATLARHQLGALAATLLDFAVMIAAVRAGLTPVAGTALGATCGAAANFTLGRQWIFPTDAPGRVEGQALRYAAVSLASLGLNTLGEFVFHDLAHVQYVVARVLVSGAVGLAWNYPLHRAWVFAPRARHE